MSDLNTLRNFRADAPVEAPPGSRAALVAVIQPQRKSKGRWLVSVAAALAVVGGTALLMGGPAAQPSAASVVLNEAAKTVSANVSSRPSDQQWFYRSAVGGWANTYNASAPVAVEGWFTFDGTKFAEPESGAGGKVRVEEVQPEVAALNGSHAEFYDVVAQLPADPEELLESLASTDLIDRTGATEAERDFNAIMAVFEHEPVPSSVKANLFRALATIPGVDVDEDAAADLLGRPVLAVTLDVTKDELGVEASSEVLFSPESYDYTGHRTVARESGQVLTGAEAFDVDAGDTILESASTPAWPVDGPGMRP